ncbi:MAG: hypothetical protein AAF203_10220 [Pseudomonadota bacterium]
MASHQQIELISDFEKLVEEILKPEPDEHQIQFLMEKIGLEDCQDPNERIALVLEKMNQLIFESKNKKADYDLR